MHLTSVNHFLPSPSPHTPKIDSCSSLSQQLPSLLHTIPLSSCSASFVVASGVLAFHVLSSLLHPLLSSISDLSPLIFDKSNLFQASPPFNHTRRRISEYFGKLLMFIVNDLKMDLCRLILFIVKPIFGFAVSSKL